MNTIEELENYRDSVSAIIGNPALKKLEIVSGNSSFKNYLLKINRLIESMVFVRDFHFENGYTPAKNTTPHHVYLLGRNNFSYRDILKTLELEISCKCPDCGNISESKQPGKFQCYECKKTYNREKYRRIQNDKADSEFHSSFNFGANS